MTNRLRTLGVIGAVIAGVASITMLIAFVIVGNWSLPGPRSGASPSGAASAGSTGTGIGGALTLTGDRTGSFVLDRETVDDRGYGLTGPDGRILFTGRPATISRFQYDGLDFFLEPPDCAYAAGDRDDETGLAEVEIGCEEVSDVRGSATISVAGVLRLPADQAGVRGDLPQTGGELEVGEDTLTFEAASLDLRRPDVIEVRPGFTRRFPVEYPVMVSGEAGTLELDFDFSVPGLRLVAVTFEDRRGEVAGDGCDLAYRRLAQLSPRVTVVEMTLGCSEIAMEGAGGAVALSGSLVVDITEFPSVPLR